jgi:NitT/TauT family transport system substrate-binding protein
VTEREHPRDLLFRFRQHDEHRQLPVHRQPITLVRPGILFVDEHAIAGQHLSQPRQQHQAPPLVSRITEHFVRQVNAVWYREMSEHAVKLASKCRVLGLTLRAGGTKYTGHAEISCPRSGMQGILALVGSHLADFRAPLIVLGGLLVASAGAAEAPQVLRVGHFPNVTHVQALVARSFSREGRGWFERHLGAGVRIEWFLYNAGPGAMEAIFARTLDLTYVGPNPAINAYTRSRGREIRIVAGAVEGGSALVVQPGSRLRTAADFRGKRIATPQLGNTQDVAARAWLARGGLRITQLGGDAEVIPTSNPDQLTLFRQRRLDAVWTVEPWVARLELEAGGRVLFEDREAVTTVLVASVAALATRRALVRSFVAAHAALTEWITSHPDEARRRLRGELAALTRAPLSEAVLERAWPRIRPTTSISLAALQSFSRDAQAAGLIRNVIDLNRLVERP